ncbi:hypothetical protein FE249_17890 (plasmid) [Acidiphilium multivorum]|uniref:hypothetical protein n=1 Tax=Acidiphilium multivorum TaxID=62140 RepID=UPI001F4C307B|nr:hypothetical protein [Acidiphilium multivorum]UNC16128.1 hypothetical protein FE249_17890 [Acidiphilium multivorum]
MAILGGIIGSLVDYDNGGARSRTQQDLYLARRQQRIDTDLAANHERSLRLRIEELERALAAKDALVKAIIAQRNMFRFELEAMCPKSPLFQDTGKVDENGQPITFAGKIWRDAYTREIKARFGADANPATFHTAFSKK